MKHSAQPRGPHGGFRAQWFAACAVVLVGLVGGCSNSAGGEGDVDTTEASVTGEVGTPAAAPNCAVAPAPVVSSTLGKQVSEPSEIANAAVTECTYLSSGGGGGTVIVRYQTQENATTFAAGRHGFEESGQPTTDVKGFLDEAYYTSSEFGDNVTNTLVARKGSVEVQVMADASIDAEKALVQKIFEKLG